MDRINIFNPYLTKPAHHEDQLTRVFLALIRYSSNVLIMFYDYCKAEYQNANISNKDERFPDFMETIEEDFESNFDIKTQKQNPEIKTEFLASVLITDKGFEGNSEKSPIDKSRERARYDGLVFLGKKIALVIENKPRSENVWFDQMNPSRENLSEDTKVLRTGINLIWKDIIRRLNSLRKIPSVPSLEKLLIKDFLDYVNEHYGFLNPYDNLSLCNNDEDLIERRVENILKSILKDKTRVDYHNGWGYIIKIDHKFDDIKMIGLIYDNRNSREDWLLNLSISFGVSTPQARTLYKKELHYEQFQNSDWSISPEFRLTYRGDKLFDIHSGLLEKYVDYWKKDTSYIGQRSREDVELRLIELDKLGIIVYGESEKELFKKHVLDTKRGNANIVPALNLTYRFNSDVATRMDGKNRFAELLLDKIYEAFELIGNQRDKLDSIFQRAEVKL